MLVLGDSMTNARDIAGGRRGVNQLDHMSRRQATGTG